MSEPRPCDQELHLYTLTHNEHTRHNFWLVKVPLSNLVLLVVDDLMGNSIDGSLDFVYPTPKEVAYNVDLECIRATGENLVRRNYMECFNEIVATVSVNQHEIH